MKLTKEKTAKVTSQVIIESIGRKTDKTFRELSTIKIKSMDDFNRAAVLVKQLKEVKKVAKEKEDSITDPLQQALDAVTELFHPFYKKVDRVELETKEDMKHFLESNKKKVLKLEERVASGKIKNIGTYVRKAEELAIDSEDASVRKVWKAEIQDEKKIPRKFLVPNTQLIVEHLRKGGAPIPGVEWKQVDSIAI